MARTRWQSLVGVAGVVTVVAWGVLGLLRGQGVVPPPVPWLVVVVMLVIAAVVLRMGWAVRQFLQGRRPDLNPLRAARTAVLAKACCYTGASLLGWYLAQVLLVVGDLGIDSQRDRAVAGGVAALGAALLAVVGLIVEHLCRVPPPSDDAAPDGEPNGTDPAAV